MQDQENSDIRNWAVEGLSDDVFRALLGAMGEGVVVHDKDGKIIYANANAQKILGISIGQMIGTMPLDPGWRIIREDGSAAGPDDIPSEIVRRTGVACRSYLLGVENTDRGTVWLNVNCDPVHNARDDKAHLAIATFSDVTLQVDAKARMIESERRLSMALGTAAAALREKTLLLARFSHELRTPLNAIIGYCDMVRLGYTGKLPDRARNYLEIVQKAGEHLNRMIGTLLDLSNLELNAQSLSRGPGNLEDTLQDAVAMVHAGATAKSVKIKIVSTVDGLMAKYDHTRIVQVLINLLSNAIRHSPNGGAVTVSMFADESRAQFKVEDNGDGIDPSRLPSIFDPFGGEHPDRPRPEGTGLGLPLSLQIMKAHGGDLTIENRESGGCCAIATLPIL